MSLNRYPDNWKELALAVKEAANWQCQRCGRLCLKPGEALPNNLKRRAYMFRTYAGTLYIVCSKPANVANCSSICASNIKFRYKNYAD